MAGTGKGYQNQTFGAGQLTVTATGFAGVPGIVAPAGDIGKTGTAGTVKINTASPTTFSGPLATSETAWNMAQKPVSGTITVPVSVATTNVTAPQYGHSHNIAGAVPRRWCLVQPGRLIRARTTAASASARRTASIASAATARPAVWRAERLTPRAVTLNADAQQRRRRRTSRSYGTGQPTNNRRSPVNDVIVIEQRADARDGRNRRPLRAGQATLPSSARTAAP